MAANKKTGKAPRQKRSTRVAGAVDLYRRFREEEPEYIEELVIPKVPDVMMLIGTLDTVEYTTRRGGKVEYYRHEFEGKSKPMLCSAWDGSQIFVVGGRYDFTEVGIKDY